MSMFMKSSNNNRNEPITRKDVRTVLGSATIPGSQQATENVKTISPSPVPEKAVQQQPAPAESEKPGEAIMGARLIVGPDVKLKGAEILDCDTLVVEGRVEATMDSRVIRIADQGAFAGKVSIDIAEIHGSFEGELTARSQLIIHATGKVSGKIRYGKLVIDEGGELCGDINALSAEKNRPSASFSEPSTHLSAISG